MSKMEGGLVVGGVRRHGRFAARPDPVNPMDEFTGLAAWRRWRLKEWVGFFLVHPEWFVSLILQDAKYLGSSELIAYNPASGQLVRHERALPGPGLRLPGDLDQAPCEFSRSGYRIEIDFASTPHRIEIDIAQTGDAPGVSGLVELDPAAASAPLSVSAPLSDGAMYTHKAIYPATGFLHVGGDTIRFDGRQQLAILDEHRSLLPYRTDWTWGTFATATDGGLVGANFATRPQPPDAEEESCLWTPAGCEPLADITFEARSGDPMAPRHIRSADGRLDVTFEPVGRFTVEHNFLLAAIDYYALYGTYRGHILGADGRHDIDGVPGVCEQMHARL